MDDFVPHFNCKCDPEMNPCPSGYSCNPSLKRCVRICTDYPEDCRCDEDNACPEDYTCKDGRCLKNDDADSDSDDDDDIPDDNFCLNNDHQFNFYTGQLANNQCKCESLLYDDEKGCSPFVQHLPIFKKLFKKMDDEKVGDVDDVDSMSSGGDTWSYLIKYMDKRALKQAAFMDRFQYFDTYVQSIKDKGNGLVEDFFDRMNVNTPERYHVTVENYWFQLCMDNAYYNICNKCRSRSSGCIDSLCENGTFCSEEGYCNCDKDALGNLNLNDTYIGKRCEKKITCDPTGTESYTCDGIEYPMNRERCTSCNCTDDNCTNCADCDSTNAWDPWYEENEDRFDVDCKRLCCKCKPGYSGTFCETVDSS